MEPIKHADAIANGFSPYILRTSPRYVHPVDGVAQLARSSHDLAATCRAIYLALPDDTVFTHFTAAQLRGWWLPNLKSPPIIACTGKDFSHHNRRGVYVRRCAIPWPHRGELDGVPVASPEWTIVELAEHLALLDLVAVIDGALYQQETSVERIVATMRKGRRGVKVLRRALELVDGRSESRWETWLRLLHILSGIPVDVQESITNRAGYEVARLDLRIRGTNRAPEYDGAGHRDRKRHEHDLRREKMLARQGIQRYGYIATELVNSPDRIIRDAEQALGWPHRADRLDLWRTEAKAATISASGAFALERRMQRFARREPPRRRPSAAIPPASAGNA
jgi:hypothetical protein